MAFHSDGNVVQTVFNYNNDEIQNTFSQTVGSFTEIDTSMRTLLHQNFQIV